MKRLSSPLFLRRGFSLIEIMVAVSVLALLLVLLLQVVNGTLMSSKTANQQMDATGNARRALDVIVSDIQNSVVGTSATILGGTTSAVRLAMLTQGRGPSGTTSPRFLAVQYALPTSGTTPDTLQRTYSAVDWTTTNLLAAAVTAAGSHTSNLASGVLALSIQATLESGDRFDISVAPPADSAWAIPGNSFYPNPKASTGTTVPSNFIALVPAIPPPPQPLNKSTARVTSLEITLVALDDQNYRLLQQSGKLETARSAFSSQGTDLPAARWAHAIDNLDGVPRPAQTALRVLTRTVPLP